MRVAVKFKDFLCWRVIPNVLAVVLTAACVLVSFSMCAAVGKVLAARPCPTLGFTPGQARLWAMLPTRRSA